MKYPRYFQSIADVHKNIKPIIKEVTEEYLKKYQVSFPIEVNLIVGGFGSNAYTHKQVIPNITFSLERLPPEPKNLKAIVAHEFGHVTHHIISNESEIDWTKIKWDSPFTWLIQEGAALHFSRQILPKLHPSVYFSFNNKGNEWLSFAESNRDEIKKKFYQDYSIKSTIELFNEWFSINGGDKFGYSRLGYFIGDLFFQNQVLKIGELNSITVWKESDFLDTVEKWLKEAE